MYQDYRTQWLISMTIFRLALKGFTLKGLILEFIRDSAREDWETHKRELTTYSDNLGGNYKHCMKILLIANKYHPECEIE